MMDTSPKKISIWDILQKRYPSNQYALMQEVSDAAGMNRSRSADYVAVSLWPSRGLTITGIELKSHRSDWLNELKNPKKAENIFRFCDYWYLLTSNDTIAKLEEIPPTWGWMVIQGSKTIIKKEAPKLNPEPITRNFLTSMLKRASDRTEFVHISAIQDKIDQSVESAKIKAKQEYQYQITNYEKLKESLAEFEKHTGIRPDHLYFKHDGISQVIKFLLNKDNSEVLLNELKRYHSGAQQMEQTLSKVIEELFTGPVVGINHEPKE